MKDMFKILATDALDTTERIGRDVRRLREIGGRAKVGAKIAIATARERATRSLEAVADQILAFERRYGAKE